ncbi:MAG: acyl carrier protein [Roseburia sp.]|nr:acyl carrier protein [Roseburia sp.]
MEQLMKILAEIKPGFDFEGRTDLVESGDLDSFDVISIVTEVNEAYDIEVPIDEIEPENFESVDAMMEMINRLVEG